MRAANRNLGFLQSFRVGTFLSVGTTGSVEFLFNGMPTEAPGGGYYEVLDIVLRYPTAAIQFTAPAGTLVTGRTLWSIFQNLSLTLGSDTPQARMRGPSMPQAIFRNLPGNMAADFLALHSRSPILDVDGQSARFERYAVTGVSSATRFALGREVFERCGFAHMHGPYGAAAAWGAASQVDFIFPIGRRSNGFEAEDLDDCAVPANWLHGKPLGPSGMAFEPAKLNLTMASTTEGGAALTLASGSVVEVWVNVVVRRPGRASLPALPVCQWAAPPGNSTDVVFAPGYHFWSGFGAQDTTGRGNVDSNLNVLTQTFATFQLRQGNNVGSYNSATEYLKTLQIGAWAKAGDRQPFNFGASDDPVGANLMATCRQRQGIFPVGYPIPLLLGMGSDALNDLVASYTTPSPATPYQLQSVYPLYTDDAMNVAARSSGIPNAVAVDAVDSAIPREGVSALIPKAVRQASGA